VARHTNATLLLSKGVSIEVVSKILGHFDIKTTQIYAKVIDKSIEDAVNKLNGLTD
jgi:site-specific recombinase XerD